MEIFRLLLLGLLTAVAGAFVSPAQRLLLPTHKHRAFASAPLLAGFGASKGNAEALAWTLGTALGLKYVASRA